MKVKSRVTMVLATLGIVMAMVIPAISQEKPSDNMHIVLEKIRADKKLLVADNMQLTEAEAKAFWPVYDQYQDELFLLRTRTVKLITDFADAYEKMTNETAKKLMDEFEATKAEEDRLKNQKDDCEKKFKRAGSLIEKLAGENVNW